MDSHRRRHHNTPVFSAHQQPPLPEHVTFDYFQHEYWRLGQLYRELGQWQLELERWEQDLTVRSKRQTKRYNHNYATGRGSNTNRRPGQTEDARRSEAPAPTPAQV